MSDFETVSILYCNCFIDCNYVCRAFWKCFQKIHMFTLININDLDNIARDFYEK